MRLNGWQRLWVVVTVLWLVGIGLVFWLAPIHVYRRDPQEMAAAIRLIEYRRLVVWFLPPIVLYALGRAAGWVARGFVARDAR